MYNINEIDVNTLVEWNEQGKNFKIVDVRSPQEIAQGVIPGGEPLPLHILPVKADELCKDTVHVFYCRSGARSAQACAFMASKGHENTVNLRGGIMAWVQNRMPIADPKQAVA
jgi:rhodanese-related sulfurtransferase